MRIHSRKGRAQAPRVFLHPLFVLVLLLALGAGWGGRSSGRAREREAEENVGLEDWERGWDHLGLRVMQGASFLFRKATGKGPVEVKKSGRGRRSKSRVVLEPLTLQAPPPPIDPVPPIDKTQAQAQPQEADSAVDAAVIREEKVEAAVPLAEEVRETPVAPVGGEGQAAGGKGGKRARLATKLTHEHIDEPKVAQDTHAQELEAVWSSLVSSYMPLIEATWAKGRALWSQLGVERETMALLLERGLPILACLLCIALIGLWSSSDKVVRLKDEVCEGPPVVDPVTGAWAEEYAHRPLPDAPHGSPQRAQDISDAEADWECRMMHAREGGKVVRFSTVQTEDDGAGCVLEVPFQAYEFMGYDDTYDSTDDDEEEEEGEEEEEEEEVGREKGEEKGEEGNRPVDKHGNRRAEEEEETAEGVGQEGR